MRRVGQVRRRDAAEKGIVNALRAVGAKVSRVSEAGGPDIVVMFRGVTYAFEVKSGRGKQTEAQKKTDWPIIRDGYEALARIGAI
jgi:Holliday junction resolvase